MHMKNLLVVNLYSKNTIFLSVYLSAIFKLLRKSSKVEIPMIGFLKIQMSFPTIEVQKRLEL